MKKLFLTSIAALFLTTGAAQSVPAYASEVWHFDNRKRCTASTEFKVYQPWADPKETNDWPLVELERRDPSLGPRGGPAPSVLEPPDTAIVRFERKHLAKLEAAVRFLKKCRPCFWDRHTDKTYCLTPKQMKELDKELDNED
jgi:hypothetical protein